MPEPQTTSQTEPQSLDDLAAAGDEMEAAGIDPVVAELDALRAERDELRDKFMRVLADAENSRKRAERDRREAEQYGGSRLARDLLPVYDNLRRALDAVTDEQRAAADVGQRVLVVVVEARQHERQQAPRSGIVEGAGAVGFLKHVKECIEDPTRLMLGM
jgi:molecular chaperone GrpE (heat shock protein)